MSARGSVRKDSSGRWGFVVDLPASGGGRGRLAGAGSLRSGRRKRRSSRCWPTFVVGGARRHVA